MIKQNCYYCKRQVKGRADKKFCNEYCRNCFHNEKRKTEHLEQVVWINRKLRYNRNLLLEQLMNEAQTVVFKRVLAAKGFSFVHFTHQLKDRKRVVWNICYDTAYRVVQGVTYPSVIIKNAEVLKK